MARSQSYARPPNVLHPYWDERTAGTVITGDQSDLDFNVVLWGGINLIGRSRVVFNQKYSLFVWE